MTHDNRKIVLLCQYASEVEARLAQHTLQNAGIPCMIANDTFSGVYPLTLTSIGAIRLMVFDTDRERARAILCHNK